MTRRVLARLDPCLKLTQVDRLHVAPNQPRQMILSEQAIENHRSQFDLIAYRLAHPWRSRPRRTGGRLALLRQLVEQSVATHRHLPRISHRRESQLGCRRLYSSPSCQRFAASEVLAPFGASLEGRRPPAAPLAPLLHHLGRSSMRSRVYPTASLPAKAGNPVFP